MGFNSVVVLTGLMVGIVGATVAIYTYYATTIKRELLCMITATEIICHSEGDFPPGLSIRFGDNYIIQGLSKHNILIWNSGNVPIRKDDFIKDAPIEITFSNAFGFLLKSSIVRESSPVNRISLWMSEDHGHGGAKQEPDERRQNRTALCNFLFLEPRDGFNIEVLHSGSIDGDPEITCNINGVPRNVKRYKRPTLKSGQLHDVLSVGFSAIIVLAAVTVFKLLANLDVTYFIKSINIFGTQHNWIFIGISIITLMLLIGGTIVVLLWVLQELRRRRPNYPPEELQTSR